MQEINLFGFGLVLELGFIFLILKQVRPARDAGDQLREKLNQIKQDYKHLQQEFQQNKNQLNQECSRLRQELQQQNDQLLQDHLQRQQEWLQRETDLQQERDRLWRALEQKLHLEQERDQLQQELGEKILQLQQDDRLSHDRLSQDLAQARQQIQERDRHLQSLEQQTAQLTEECQQLHQALQQQQVQLTNDLSQATFQQLQTLLINYPSACKIAQAKPNLPAKSLTSMFTPLENLLQTWGYETIGPIWAAVAYDPQLHQPDIADIQPGEQVYVRFVGYRKGETILCPAKVSRILPGTGRSPTVN